MKLIFIILYLLLPTTHTSPINLHLSSYKQENSVFTLSDEYVKFTTSVGLNKPNWLVKPMDKCNELDDINYFNIILIDIRLKIYLSKRFRLLNRVLIKGDMVHKYTYQTGIIYKF